MPTRSRKAGGGASPATDSRSSQPGDQSVDPTRVRPICPACGSTNRPQSQFCADCGAPLRTYCPHCGFDYSRFVAGRLIGRATKPESEAEQPRRPHPSTILMAALIVLSVLLMLYILSQI